MDIARDSIKRRMMEVIIEKTKERERCENDLAYFLRQSWPSMERTNYVEGFHTDAVCEHLMAVSNGEINRLLINIPPRTGKPVSALERVLTKRGLVPLGEIMVGDMVWTHRGRFRKVLAVHDQGVIPSVCMLTRMGRRVIAAPSHPFLTPDGWEEIGKLKDEDVVGLPPCRDECGADSSIEEARLLGYLIGDGRCTGTPNITSADDAVTEDIIFCSEALGFYATETKYKLTGDNRWLRRVSIRATPHGQMPKRGPGNIGPVRQWLESHNLWEQNSYTKCVPEKIFRSSNLAVRNFIAAYWSCDGWISSKGVKRDGSIRNDFAIGCNSVNRTLLENLQVLFWRIGINSRIRNKSVKKKTAIQGDIYHSYELTLTCQDDVCRFLRLIDLKHARADKLRAAYLRRFDFDHHMWGDIVESVKPYDDTHCICLSVEEDRSFTANGFAVHNTNAVSIAWPAWTWAQRELSDLTGPQVPFLCASYGNSLSLDISTKCRRLIESDWYQRYWSDRFKIREDQNTKSRFDTDKGGTRIATSVGGALTGLGANILILDDIHNAQEMESQAVIKSAVQWFSEGLQSRLNNPKTGAIVVIMQRLSDEDLSGYILAKEAGYVHLNLPLEYDPSRHCATSIGWSDPRTEEGELLCPRRIGPEEVIELKKALGTYAYHGQYQQSPTPRGGGIIKERWWKAYPEYEEDFDEDGRPVMPLEFPIMEFVVASLDSAYTEKEENDYSALTVWGVWRKDGAPKVMLMAAWQERLELHDLITKVYETCTARKGIRVDKLLIENKASGKSVAQEIIRLFEGAEFGVEMVEPKGDKVSRMYSVQHLFENGVVYAPWRPWSQMVIDEVTRFPKGAHKDTPDTVSMALSWLRNCGFALRTDEHDDAEIEERQFKKQTAPLYDV